MEKEENLTLAFVKRWIKAFSKLFKMFGNRTSVSNQELVDGYLADEQDAAHTDEDKQLLEEKRKVMLETCEEVDAFYAKRAEARKAEDLERWFEGEVEQFAKDTIPDADEKDIKEVKQEVDKLFDRDIEVKTEVLKDAYESDNQPDQSSTNELSHE